MNTINLKNTKILKTINLIDYDHDFYKLYNELLSIKKNKYSIDEKIIILHNDTEYFYYDSPIGFSIHNLLTCIQQADIPMHVFVILTNHCYYKKSIIDCIKNKNDIPTIIFTYVNNVSFTHVKEFVNNKNNIEKNIKYFALGLWGGTVRPHRTALIKWLKYKNLDKKIQISYNSYYNKKKTILNLSSSSKNFLENKNTNVVDIPLDLVTANTHRTNETFLSQNSTILKNWIDTPDEPFYNDFIANNNLTDVYSKCFLDVVSETTFMYPYPFISEKTIRPILLKTPFLIFGGQKTLQCLHDAGFKTFDNFWDESYDQVANHWERFDKICELVESLSKMSLTDLEIMYNEMKPILEYNKNLLTEYISNNYYPLYNEIKKHV